MTFKRQMVSNWYLTEERHRLLEVLMRRTVWGKLLLTARLGISEYSPIS